jgi:glycosyltransferase 2 family protein
LFGFIRNWRIGLLGLAVSLLAIYFILSEINIDLLDDALKSARFEYILPCVALLLAGLVTRAFRWRLLLSDGLSLMQTFHIMNVAYLVNGVLPLRIGEVARAFLASRAEPPVPIFKSISTIVVERLLDLLAVVMLIAFALMSGPVPDKLRVTGLFFGVSAFSGFLLLVFLSRKRELAHRLLAIFTTRLSFLQKFKLSDWLDHFLDGLLPLTKINTLLRSLGWTAISWGFSVAAGYVLMYTFYDEPSWAVTCLYIAAAAFAIAVPAVPGNIGTYEASIMFALVALGYGDSETVAVAFAVIVHAVNVGVHSVTGVIGFIYEGITLQQLSQGVRNVTEKTEINEISEFA